jgi:hypothetical protein
MVTICMLLWRRILVVKVAGLIIAAAKIKRLKQLVVKYGINHSHDFIP